MPTPIITDGSMDRMVHAPKVVLPGQNTSVASIFRDRASRFDALASQDHNGDYMRFMAHVCRGQCKAIDARTAQRVEERAVANSREHGMPPLSAHVFPRDAAWRDDLNDILSHVQSAMGNANQRLNDAIAKLQAQAKDSPNALESIADRLIALECSEQDGPAVPFVGAALQVYFTRMAATLQAEDVSRCDVATVCPCCGMRPTASIVRLDAERMNYRYLVCSLCMTEWNMERVRCSSCETEKDIGYMIIDVEGRAASEAPIRAETCEECKTYLKLFVQEKIPEVDVLADDLNSLALDLLVDEKGYSRTGPNLLFYPGRE